MSTSDPDFNLPEHLDTRANRIFLRQVAMDLANSGKALSEENLRQAMEDRRERNREILNDEGVQEALVDDLYDELS